MSRLALQTIAVAAIAAGAPAPADEPALAEALREAGLAPVEIAIDPGAVDYFDATARPVPLVLWSLRHPLQMSALAEDISLQPADFVCSRSARTRADAIP